MASIKSVRLTPQQKKQYLLAFGAGLILLAIVMISAYFTQKKADQLQLPTDAPETDTVNLIVPGQQLKDADIWRANEGSKIVSINKQIEEMKSRLDKTEIYQKNGGINGNAPNNPPVTQNPPGVFNDVPMPPDPTGSVAGIKYPMSGSQLPPPPKPQVPSQSATTVNSKSTETNIEPEKEEGFSLEVSSDSEDKKGLQEDGKKNSTATDTDSPSNDGDSDASSNTQAESETGNTAENFLPSGTFMRAVMLAGLDAPTGGQAQSNPHPVLFRVLDPAQLPNQFQANMKDCVLTGNAHGDMSSERAYPRLDRLSCIDEHGRAIDVPVKGYIAGEDGKAGMRGRLVSKQGHALANAALAGIASGMGQAFTQSASTISQSPLGATQTVNQGKELQAGLASGVGSAMSMLAKYYIRLAEQIFPVIEVDGGRIVDIVLTKGVSVSRRYERVVDE